MESKGVLGSIATLFENHEYLAGGALLLFCILHPLFKTLSMLFVARFIQNQSAHSVVLFFKMLRKTRQGKSIFVANKPCRLTFTPPGTTL